MVKKMLTLIAMFLMLFVLVSCKSQNDSKSTKEVALTYSNYSQYLSFSYDVKSTGSSYNYTVTFASTSTKYSFKNCSVKILSKTITIPSSGNTNYTIKYPNGDFDLNLYMKNIKGTVVISE